MLPTDPNLELWLDRAPLFDSDRDQSADPLLIEDLEGILLEETLLHISGEEGRSIITRDTEGRLCQVLGAEGAEVGMPRDLPSLQSCSREFDHRADEVFYFSVSRLADLLRYTIDHTTLRDQL